MTMGPVLYQAPRARRHHRWRSATLVLALLVAAAATVGLRAWTAPRRPAPTRPAASARPARPSRTGRRAPAVTGPAALACPPAAPLRRRAGEPVGAGGRAPPAAVRHSPTVRYRLPAAAAAAKTVALTFDDGPDPRFTPRIVAILARARMPATFFMVGRQAAAHPRLVRRVALAGQAVVGGHTWNHIRLDRLPQAGVAAEVDCTNQLLARLAGRPVRLVRPPDGAYDRRVVEVLAARGLQLILWTADSRDWARPGVQRIVATVTRQLRPGAIILFHDGGGDRSQTVAALPKVLRQLHAHGYRAVALPTKAAALAKRSDR
jgi:peptidoglycan/xylan/chitin deacetylase (PgdA/CDA1 family)